MNLVCGYVGQNAHVRFQEQLNAVKSVLQPNPVLNVVKAPDAIACFAISQPEGFFPLNKPFYDSRVHQLCMLHGYFWYQGHFPVSEADAMAQLTSAAYGLSAEHTLSLGSSDGGVFTFYAYDERASRLHIVCDYSGIMPCYYSLSDDGFFFSSHIRVLSQQLQPVVDPIGIIQQTSFHHTIGKRSIFSNIFRLMPGEALSYDVNTAQLVLAQPKVIYSAITRYKTDSDAADAIYSEFVNGISELSKPVGLRGVLLSGGYDSRLVAKGFKDQNCPLTSVVIGDQKNLEVRLAKQVAKALDSEIHVVTPIKDCQLDVELIQELMQGPESVNYTHFLTPGKLLKQCGAISLSTGYGGDTLLEGNGYALLGDVYSNRNRFKLGVYRSLGLPLHFSAEFSTFGVDRINASVQSFYLKKLRQVLQLFRKDWVEESINSIFSQTIEDIEAEVKRLSASNPESPFQLIERFWREHQERYTSGIVTTLANYLPVVLPIMHPKFVEICSNLSPAQKVDNGIYQKIVRKYFGKLANIPTGSTPLSAAFPDLFLLSSRALRSMSDTTIVRKQVKSKGKTQLLRYGWPNFEYWFRQGSFLENSKNFINYDIYSREYCDQKIDRWINWDERLFSGQELLTLITISQLLS